MLLIREIMYCKPGKVKPMVEKFLAMSRINERAGFGRTRVMTDFAGSNLRMQRARDEELHVSTR
jgi:hypothetical protein